MVSLFGICNPVSVCLCFYLCIQTDLHASNVKLPGAKLALVNLQEKEFILYLNKPYLYRQSIFI